MKLLALPSTHPIYGLTTEQIGDRMHLAPKTVARHFREGVYGTAPVKFGSRWSLSVTAFDAWHAEAIRSAQGERTRQTTVHSLALAA